MNNKDIKRSVPFKERFKYWFDNRMAKGSLGFIRILIIASVLLALIVALLIIALGLSPDKSRLSVFWDSISTVINAWMPESSDGSIGYLLLMAVAALAGVLFTSVLIGIVTSAIEERIVQLKRGNSKVLEEGHVVVLGFYPGEYTLINQLILAAAGKKDCIVVAENMDRETMEGYIKDNIDIPKNIKIICRTVDILDPSSIEKCSIDTCRTIIVHPTDDSRTIKTLLAVSTLMHRLGKDYKPVNAIISRKEHGFPPSLAQKNNITALQTNDTLAKMIAHSCTQTGLSDTFREVFNFEGSELYIITIPGVAGITFGELMVRLDLAVPVGIYNDGRINLNPASDTVILESDRIVVFAPDDSTYRLVDDDYNCAPVVFNKNEVVITSEDKEQTVILGYNEALPVILRELPENLPEVYLAGNKGSNENQYAVAQIAEKRGLTIKYIEGELLRDDTLLKIAQMAKHIIVLNDHDKSDDDADMETVFLLLNLRELRTRFGLDFNITAEMRREHNQSLVVGDDHTDFLVASSMSSLFLAQLAENPELIEAFSELLSNEGNELYLKNIMDLQCEGRYTVRELRRFASKLGFVMIGIKSPEHESVFNPPLDEEIDLGPGWSLIVLSEN